MTKSIVIYNELEKCINLFNIFREKSIYLSESLLILPPKDKINSDQQELLNLSRNNTLKIEEFENIRILNPKLDRKIRQKNMSSRRKKDNMTERFQNLTEHFFNLPKLFHMNKTDSPVQFYPIYRKFEIT